jgi:hypothetical protein
MHDDDEAAYSGEDEVLGPGGRPRVCDPEVWMDHWSEELVTLWHGVVDHARAMGAAVLDTCDFPSFAEFCYKHSSGFPPVV